MHIQVTDTVLTGNMGEGWRDQHKAAEAYATFLHDSLWQTVVAYWPKADITIAVAVEDATGSAPPLRVDGDLPALHHAQLEADLHLIVDGTWEEFCNSSTARTLMI